MSEIKVSVIIPIYNVEEYLEECLVSALNQTLKEIEIICVNDGTPDNSMSIVEKYQDDERVVVVNKVNGGLSSARNAGMEVAKGEYVYFLDSDDYIVPECLENLYVDAKEKDLDIIFFDAESFYESKKLEREQAFYSNYYIREPKYEEVVSGIEIFEKWVEDNAFRTSACLQLIRRTFLIDNKISFYEGIIHEDNLFSLECIVEAKRVRHVAKQYYKRRVREGSIMTDTKKINSSLGYYKTIEGLVERIKDKEYTDSQKDAIFKRLYLTQSHCFNAIIDLEKEEIDQIVKNLPMDRASMYKLIVVRMAEERARLNRSNEAKAKLKTSVAKWKYKNKKLKAENKKLKKELNAIKSRFGYKFRQAILYWPKVAFKFLKNYKSKGKTYARWTLKNFLTKRVLVSVIIPVYNAKPYLKECLDSLKNQTLKNIEIICVNDGSTDTSLDILRKYEAKDKRFKVIDKPNSGAGDCRNVGMKQAKGQYLLFLDADDIFAQSMCEKACFQIMKDKADICFFGAQRFNMQTYENEPMGWVMREEMFPKKRPFIRENLNDKFFQMTTGCAWAKLFKREFIEQNNIQFMNIHNANDLFFVRTAMALAGKMTYVKNKLVFYRVGMSSNTQATKYKAPLEFYKAYKALKERLVKEGVYEELEQSFINLAFDDCMFNVRTITEPEANNRVKTALLEEGFEYFGFANYPEEYFYNKNSYSEYIDLIEHQK